MKDRVLIVDDDKSILWVLNRLLTEKGLEVMMADNGERAMELLVNHPFSLAMIDIMLPGKNGLDILKELQEREISMPVIIMTAEATMKNAIEAMKSGAFDYITKPFELDELDAIIDKAMEYHRLKKEVSQLKVRLQESLKNEVTFIGKCREIQGVFKTIGKISAKDVTVLIQGESGTGKELLAKLIHMNSPRKNGPFVALNTAAIPKELMESELFGFEKGSFTGASETRKGKFELAEGGTLFLDEIGDMPPDLQSKLLRAIQEKEFYPLGGKEPKKVNVRIISATNQDLKNAVEEKRFREDLYYRLNVFTIKLPPLRARKDDMPLLVEYFLNRFQEEMGIEPRKLTPNAMEKLRKYRWPGNVRELENTLRRAVVLSPNLMLTSDDLAIDKREKCHESIEDIINRRLEDFIRRIEPRTRQELYATVMPYMERPLIKLVLKKTKGNQVRTAELLGINRNTLRKKIRELGIDVTALF